MPAFAPLAVAVAPIEHTTLTSQDCLWMPNAKAGGRRQHLGRLQVSLWQEVTKSSYSRREVPGRLQTTDRKSC